SARSRRPGRIARHRAARAAVRKDTTVPARRPARSWLPTAACACVLSVAAACTAGGAARPGRPTPESGPPRPPAAARPAIVPPALRIAAAAYQLPAGISREVVLPTGQDLLIVGGLTGHGATTGAVTRLDPVTGRTRPAGRL